MHLLFFFCLLSIEAILTAVKSIGRKDLIRERIIIIAKYQIFLFFVLKILFQVLFQYE
jgi:hypothetical protein